MPITPFESRPRDYAPDFSEGDIVQFCTSYVGGRGSAARLRFVARNMRRREEYNGAWTADLYQITRTDVSPEPNEHFARFFDPAEPIEGLQQPPKPITNHKMGVPKGKLP